ncbi:hypothetical protein ABB37_02892 [Leptomonas pyrrhocoris]|uniref:DUF3147 family protein n=1 Tax=Leptomonas pyrrhocoris TaxID=157538 RepID=A0A0N0DXP1_LEPPY|nr:hypothetical protein ABB37_02892 [Leptomonas pyrrhocoris]KPA83208.1 hypothetical protein ABB37_02892 [Leptomonas pyrrhocoris]|eukprot:XP_015661647.1 hypothetical protein ABB37_02892 [Leptomonas pyrrhocoris]
MDAVYLVFKYALTSAIIVGVSEAAKRSDRLGGLLAALPIVTVLTLIWLQVEGQSRTLISNHAWYTLWYVIPTLPMFLTFPCCFDRFGFWGAMGVSCLATVVVFVLFGFLLSFFGIYLIWRDL